MRTEWKAASSRAPRFHHCQQCLQRERQNRLLIVDAVDVVGERVELVMGQLPLLHKLDWVYALGLQILTKRGLRVNLLLYSLLVGHHLRVTC